MSTSREETGSPGSHLRNWQPGDDDAEELMLQKIADALRDGKSERQIAKLLNVPRTWLWRGKNLAAIPEGLYERLAEAKPRIGVKAKLYVGRWFRTGEEPDIEAEYCPHCGHELRVRSSKGIHQALGIVHKWIEDGRPNATDQSTPPQQLERE